MELTCTDCSARFRVMTEQPLDHTFRVVCPACGRSSVVGPDRTLTTKPLAVVADEPRDFRDFLQRELSALGFDVAVYDQGLPALERIRSSRADLAVLNVYLRDRLGIELVEEIRNEGTLADTKVVLIGALFRANRFRANATSMYGADEYIEEVVPAPELRRILVSMFPDLEGHDTGSEKENEEARRIARLVLSDILIYHADKVEEGIRQGTFFSLLDREIADGRMYWESKVSPQIRERSDHFNDVLEQFVQMKREELARQESEADLA